jgi:ABC-type glycerol-3-phosphate transport system substrate-binding protein
MLYWNHFVPSFIPLLNRQVEQWARSRGVNARVDYISLPDMPARLAAEAQARTGHDIIQLSQWNAQLFRQELLPVDDVVADLDKQWGPFREPGRYLSFAEGHWYAVPWHFWSDTATINTSYWRQIGYATDNVAALGWEELAAAGARLRDAGHPVGVAVSQTGDANDGLYPLLWSFGGRTVDERGEVVIDSRETADSIEFVKTKLFPVMPREVLGWNDASNNQEMLSGVISWTPNPPSIWAVAHLRSLPIERDLDQVPMPRGPKGRFRSAYGVGLGIWRFSPRAQLAKDLVRYLLAKPQSDQQVEASLGYNEPFLAQCAANPFWKRLPVFRYYEPPKETVRVPGWPGPASKGAALTYNLFTLPLMYAKAVTGQMTTSQAIKWAEGELKKAYGKG